jgi:hypothetical protein
MKVRVQPVALVWQAQVFAALGEYIEAALAHSAQYEWTLGELVQRCADDEFRMIAAVEDGPGPGRIIGCMVFSTTRRQDGQRVLTMICAAGQAMDRWLDPAVQLLFSVARVEACSEIIVLGRRGWLRECAKYGLKLRAVVAAADVPEGPGIEHDLAAVLTGYGGE